MYMYVRADIPHCVNCNIVCMLCTGIPSRPDPPTMDSSNGSIVVMVTTQHSGVRDNVVDEFHFILKVLFTL